MKLVKLSANKPSFHAVEFKDGLNIIVGKQATPHNENDGNTYNGIGKSLLIHLIHFCLGSNAIDAFSNILVDWGFTLEFELDNEYHRTSRYIKSQNKITLDGQEKSLSDVRSFLMQKCFGISDSIKNITLNTLLSRFVRRYRNSYSSFDTYVPKEQDYAKLLNNAFLLGIDFHLIEKKKELRDKQQNALATEKAIKKDPIFREYYLGEHDEELDVIELEHSIAELEKKIEQFKVSNDYHNLEAEANEKSYKKKQLENTRALVTMHINNIKNALDDTTPEDYSLTLQMYEQAQVEIPEMVKRRLEEVISFHNKLVSTRNIRLKNELLKHQQELERVDQEIQVLGTRMDILLGYLNTHGALDEYSALSKQLTDLQTELSHINEYKKILKTYKDMALEIKADYIKQDKLTEDYLSDKETYLIELKTRFFDLAKRFYPRKKSGLIIKNNSGENTLRFNIDARIEDDSSDGVNEVRIFCFDLMMLTCKVSNMRFIMHDSRLFANMDPRQRATLLEVADEYCKNEGLQYICTINEDVVRSIEPLLNSEDYKKLVTDNIILQLNDDSAASKLLGIQVDINLEK